MDYTAFVYGFYISDNLNSYILFSPITSQFGGPTEPPTASEFPSLNNVNDQIPVLQLAPVGIWVNPFPFTKVAAVSAEQKFLYSSWDTSINALNPADTFTDWKDWTLEAELNRYVNVGVDLMQVQALG